MKSSKALTRAAIIAALAAILFTQTPSSLSKTATTKMRAATVAAVVPAQANNIGVNGFYSVSKAQRGRTFQAAIVLDIPRGYHVNANKPLGKYAIPTTLRVEAPGGVRVGAVGYPRAVVRSLKFAKGERLAFYEGRAVMRFDVTVPANYQQGVTELRAKVRFQSCTDEVCYPPATRDITLPIGVVGANDPVQRINTNIFGGGRGRRR